MPGIVDENRDFGRTISKAEHLMEKEVLKGADRCQSPRLCMTIRRKMALKSSERRGEKEDIPSNHS